MDIEIKKIEENPILHRKKVFFTIFHLGEGSPNRIEVRDKLAAMQTADTDLTFIMSMKPRFGIPEIHGIARIYDDAEVAKKVEKDYIKIRNMPKEKRADAWKEVKARRKRK